MVVDADFMQGQSWKILSGGGYYAPQRTFVDEMWAAYRSIPQITSIALLPGGIFTFTVENLAPNKTNFIQVSTNLASTNWLTISTNVAATNAFSFQENLLPRSPQRFFRVKQAP
jgi:hypothetical protein